MPLAASAAPATASPNAEPSARRSIFRRVANACLTTSSNSAASRTGASGAARGARPSTDDVTDGAGWNDPGRTWNNTRASARCATAIVSRPYVRLPGGATIRCAISRWTITTARATSPRAPASTSDRISALAIWYGRLPTTTTGRPAAARAAA